MTYMEDPVYFKALKDWLSTRKFKRGLEIGLCWGMSAQAFLETQKAPLTSVDLADQLGVQDSLKQLGDFTFVQGSSPSILIKLEGKFDYIYIDGDHEYQGIELDLRACRDLLAEGGTMVCDDYGTSPGVERAVGEYAKKYNQTIHKIPNHPNGAVWLEPPS